jgi:hypothetical protein
MKPKSLPPSKINSTKFLPSSSISAITKKNSVKSLASGDKSGNLGIIKKQVIKISDLIKTNTLLKQAEETKKRKLLEQKKFSEREEKLEAKPEKKEDNKVKLPGVPKLSFLDRIKKFLFNILLGFIVVRLLPQLPKLMGVVKLAGQALDFVTDWGGKLLNGLVTFIDWGYKAYDSTRNFLKNIGGENTLKVFDGFIGVMDKVIEASIIAAIAFGDLGGGDFGPDVKKGQKASPSKVGGRGLSRSATRLSAKLFGRGGAKTILKFIRPFTKRLPIIGGLLDFGLSIALGEPLGRAAFKAIGAGILGTIGTGFGGPIGAILGGLAGDWAGGKLYDIFFEKKSQDQPKVQGRAQGGVVTRGGRFVGGPAKREVKKTKVKREVNIHLPKLKPGADVGGEKQIKKIFPESTKTDMINPLGYTENFYEKTDDIPFFGPIFGLVTKTLLGDKPNSLDYENIGKGLNSWMSNTFSSEVMRTGGAFVGGGEVNAEMFMRGEDLTKVIAKSVEKSVSSRLDETINDLMNQLRLKPPSTPAGVPGPSQPGSEDLINIQGGDADFWTLVAVASREDGEPQAWADVAQSIYNRLASGAYSGKSIKELVLGQMQYEPTWKFPRSGATGKPNSEWFAIKDAASAGVASGQSEDAMKKVAAAILDPTLQKNAREFIQGRTDFRGYSVSGGIQRKGGDNYFGWYNNYRENKVGSVPNFGATASGGSGGTGGTGGSYTQLSNNPDAKRGSKLAGELGRFLDAKGLGRWGSGVHQHPEHPAWSPESGHSPGSLHYASQGARAIDIGGYGRSRGYSDQDQILAGIAEFNKLKGVKPIQLLKDGYPGHDNHVHVAYGRGGLVRGFTRAILGERGVEFVLDTDTTSALEQNFPGFLDALNKANYDGAINVLRDYAYYESGSMAEVIVEQPEPEVVMVPVPTPQQSVISSPTPLSSNSWRDHAYMQG